MNIYINPKVKNNRNATRPPTLLDDAAQGYSKDSVWEDDLFIYRCKEDHVGCAVWEVISVKSWGTEESVKRWAGILKNRARKQKR